MRIIAGSARGRKLFTPEGIDVRPTTDKVKESLFNIIQFEIPGARVLDLFAGTGQLGLEALSRGAAEAVFVDASGKSLATVKKNAALCGFSMGGIGVISVVANVAPKAMHDLCQKFFDGDIKGAARLQMDTHELFETLFCEVNPIPVKKAVNLMGLNAGPLRMPLTEMTPANTEKLRKAMQNFGLI